MKQNKCLLGHVKQQKLQPVPPIIPAAEFEAGLGRSCNAKKTGVTRT